LYTEENAVNLRDLQFITRIPNNIKLVKETISKSLANTDNWETLANGRLMQVFKIEHYGIQRWYVLSSETSQQRAKKQVYKRVSKDAKLLEKQLFHLQAQ